MSYSCSCETLPYCLVNKMDIPENPSIKMEHPLYNKLIIDKICNYVQSTFTDLKNLRLVCKFWHENTLSRWRNLAVINISPDAPLFSARSTTSIGALKFLQEFENPHSIHQFAEKPFSNYKIYNFTIDINACDTEPESKQFWDQIGPHMKHVQFKRCEFLDEDGGGSLVELLVRKIPNIEELVLADITSKSPSANENHNSVRSLGSQVLPHLKTLRFIGYAEIQRGLSLLLKCTPKLNTIKSEEPVTWGDFTCTQPVSAIALAGKDAPECLANLKHLDFINSNFLHSSSGWRRLSNSNIRLESLTARKSSDSSFRADSTGIDNFLTLQTKCLKRLEIFRDPFFKYFHQFLEGFEMDGLTQLKLWGNVTKNLHFLKNTPNLQVLYVNTICFEKWAELRRFSVFRNSWQVFQFQRYEQNMAEASNENLMQGVMLANLRVLHITFDFSVQSWTQLGQWMPNLEELQTVINKSTVAVVCRQWPNLTELSCLFGSNIDNSSITGSNIELEKNEAIVGLKSLKTFQLDALCNSSTLSDDAAVHGFLKMPALKNLQICVSSEMSAEVEESLKNIIPKCRLIRNYGSGEHSNYECCQRTRFMDEAATGFEECIKWFNEKDDKFIKY